MWASYMMDFIGRRSYKKRSASDIEQDIAKLKIETSERVDAAMLDRRAYCITNALVNIEREIPVLERHLESMECMPKKVRKKSSWIMDHAYVVNRLESYRATVEDGTKEIESIKQQLKDFQFSKDRKELDEELAEINDIKVINEGDEDQNGYKYEDPEPIPGA